MPFCALSAACIAAVMWSASADAACIIASMEVM